MGTSKCISRRLKGIVLFILLTTSVQVSAQFTISGAGSVSMGAIEVYNINPTGSIGIAHTDWSAVGGTVISISDDWSSATVEWYNNPLSGAVHADVLGTNNIGYEKSLPVTVSVPNPSMVFSISNGCGLKTISYTASPPSNIIWYWQDVSNGQSTNNPTKTYSNVGTDGYYYVRARYGTTWSPGAAQTPYVDVVQPPGPPTVNHNNPNWNTYCDYTMTVTNPQGGYTYRWYNTETGGTAFHTGTSLTVNHTSPGYYPRWVESYNGQCASNIRTTINFTATNIPGPTGSNKIGYPGCEVVLTVAPQSSHTYKWYTAPTSGTLVFQGFNYPVSFEAAGDYDYYVSDTYQNGCEGVIRTKVTAHISPLSTTSASIFVGQDATLSIVDPQTGFNYVWYTESGSGPLAHGTSYSVPNSQAGIFTYKANACASGVFAANKAYVYPKPLILSSVTRLGGIVYIGPGEAVTLTSNNSYSIYSWKKDGVEVGSGQSLEATEIGTYILTVSMTDQNGTISFTSASLIIKKGLDDQNINYIETNTIQVGGITSDVQIDVLPIGNREQSITYFDGLGRPIQSITTGNSVDRKDIVQPVHYDAFGREKLKFLPSVISQGHGRYKSGLVTSQGDYNTEVFSNGIADKIDDDTRPFTETIFDGSPLNRPVKLYGLGNDWYLEDKATEIEYLTIASDINGRYEEIIIWKVDNVTGMLEQETSINSGFYEVGQLTIQSTTDEEGNVVREYTDKSGKVILKKVQSVVGIPDIYSNSDWASTYYIYDDFGNLVVVLPPEAVNSAIMQLIQN